MWFNELEIPDELLDSHENGKLVIFTGAGISKQADLRDKSGIHCLGWIDGLVECIKEKILFSKDKKDKKEEADQFFGRLSDVGKPVNQWMQDVFFDSKCNDLSPYETILNLFVNHGGKRKIRLITTNVDPHLESAVANIGTDLDRYYYPALPYGKDFSGIAYLHGCVTQDKPENLVFSDRDFAIAYIIKRHVTDFILDIFDNYSVLFIGYSLKDIVFDYLTKGITENPEEHNRHKINDNKLYIILQENEHEDLENASKKERRLARAFKPINYAEDEKGHSKLWQGLSEWVVYEREDTITQKERIKDYIKKGPLTLETYPPDRSYLERIIKNNPQSFYSNSQLEENYQWQIEWLFWTESKGYLDPIFESALSLDNNSMVCAHWFAQNFIVQHSKEASLLIIRRLREFRPEFWWIIAPIVSYKINEIDKDGQDFWIQILLDNYIYQIYQFESSRVIAYLLDRCSLLEDKRLLIQLYAFLTQPQANYSSSVAYRTVESPGYYPTPSLELRGIPTDLEKTWRKIKEADELKHIARELLPHLETNIRTAYRILRIDILFSYNRSSVIDRNNRYGPDAADILIDITRDCLIWLCENEPDYALCVINKWIQDGNRTLTKIAIYGVCRLANWNPAQKGHWLIGNSDLLNPQNQSELVHFMKEVYPELPVDLKEELLELILGISEADNNEEELD